MSSPTQTLVFATRNPHKAAEVRALLKGRFHILTLPEAGINEEIPEPFPTLEENALAKTDFLFQRLGCDCFSEDTGLEVNALGGEPGVRSARYAGEPPQDAANQQRLLERMQGVTTREARFRTVFSLCLQGKSHCFEGICEGRIAEYPAGKQGFGYDPVFIPTGAGQTFAEMGMEAKNHFSHRRKALDAMLHFLGEGI
ncbi:MAG: RdgB/HAM1 family non-canonical purine NTP pyrophosphatase [Bacteroidetes bacterium]|nr:RdgB/HAM1 family non-canonical purine NTP pyrophosphatase [Bacteroidota bacterium]